MHSAASPRRAAGLQPALPHRRPAPACPAQFLERAVDTVCLFATFKGVRGGKTLMQMRRAQWALAKEKKEE